MSRCEEVAYAKSEDQTIREGKLLFLGRGLMCGSIKKTKQGFSFHVFNGAWSGVYDPVTDRLLVDAYKENGWRDAEGFLVLDQSKLTKEDKEAWYL